MINCWKRVGEDQIEKCEFDEVLQFLESNKEIECDTETTGLDPHINDIICIQFGNPDHQYLVEWGEKIILPLSKYLQDKSKLFIFQNAKFDLQFLYKYNIIVSNVWDTFLAECVLTTGNSFARRNLKYLAQKYLEVDMSKEIRKHITSLGLTNEVISYGLYDVKYLSRIKEKQLIEIDKYNLRKALDLDNRFVPVLAYIEYCGTYFDPVKWLENDKENKIKSTELLNEMDNLIVKLDLKKYYNYASLFSSNPIVKDGIEYESTINWTSPKQVVELFKDLGINVTVDESGEIKESVGKKILQQNKGKHPLVDLYAEFIKNQKLISSFGEKYLKFINPVTNRVHSSYKQIMNTGRMSSGDKADNKPNMQQLPAEGRYRQCFIAEPGNVLISSDYSGMETVVFANKCLDPALLDFYDNGEKDMHSLIAKMCFPEEIGHMSLEEIKDKRPDLRQAAKAAGFAIQFGGVGYTIADNLGISEEEGNKVYEAYMKGFPGAKKYFDDIIKETHDNGYITFNDTTNRKSFFYFKEKFDVLKKDIDKMDWTEYRREKNSNSLYFNNVLKPKVREFFQLKGQMDRKALNFPVQGSSADITKYALILLWNYILKNDLFKIVKICNVVHDEIIVECPEDMSTVIGEVVVKSMRDAGSKFFTRVPLNASCDIGNHWIH